VASLEAHEPPYEEFYRVSRQTAERINAARRAGHRVVAAGTTVVRAIETVADEEGIAAAGRGWTDLVISPERPLRRGYLWHEFGDSHLIVGAARDVPARLLMAGASRSCWWRRPR
jgi:S-adenosylmethionine:tRNA ribosyltransferase-isomerase